MKNSGAAENADSKKGQRQQSAELRKKLNPINNAIKKVEQEMAKIDNAIQAIESALGESDLYEESNKEKLQTLLQDQGKLKQEKDQQEDQWFELQEKLEGLQNEASS